jgi:hypothetical protein
MNGWNPSLTGYLRVISDVIVTLAIKIDAEV